jgi:hypothetical protein
MNRHLRRLSTSKQTQAYSAEAAYIAMGSVMARAMSARRIAVLSFLMNVAVVIYLWKVKK